jgi:hypothetical protein
MDDASTDLKNYHYQIGLMFHERFAFLEKRVDGQDDVLKSMDAKLDTIVQSLAVAAGKKELASSIVKLGFSTIAAASALCGVVFAFLHIGVPK